MSRGFFGLGRRLKGFDTFFIGGDGLWFCRVLSGFCCGRLKGLFLLGRSCGDNMSSSSFCEGTRLKGFGWGRLVGSFCRGRLGRRLKVGSFCRGRLGKSFCCSGRVVFFMFSRRLYRFRLLRLSSFIGLMRGIFISSYLLCIFLMCSLVYSVIVFGRGMVGLVLVNIWYNLWCVCNLSVFLFIVFMLRCSYMRIIVRVVIILYLRIVGICDSFVYSFCLSLLFVAFFKELL